MARLRGTAGKGLLLTFAAISLLLGLLSVRLTGGVHVRVPAAEPVAESRPGVGTGLNHPYVFLWIWEDNSPHAFRGFSLRQGVTEAASYHIERQAVTIYQPVTLGPETRLLVLTEASAGDTLLHSELHPIGLDQLPWRYRFPAELSWAGVYRAGPRAGEVDNMVANEHRYLRVPIMVLGVEPDGRVTLDVDGSVLTLMPGEGHPVIKMVDKGRGLYSRLVLYNQGIWHMRNVTIATTESEGR